MRSRRSTGSRRLLMCPSSASTSRSVSGQSSWSPLSMCGGGERAVLAWRQMLALGQSVGETLESGVVFGKRPATVGCRGRTRIAQSNAPLIAHRDEHEGKQPARERLGLVAETLVNPAAALRAEEDAAAVVAVIQLHPPRPRRADALEGCKPAQIIGLPVLLLDALDLVLGERDAIFLATGAGCVAVPVLHDGEVLDRQGHDSRRCDE